VSDDRLAALRAPAGLDLGAETPEEIAISILGELVQVRRGTAAFVAAPGPATLAGAGAPVPSSSRSWTISCSWTPSAG
jgi:xanthine dehydrogenase accessory factor